MADPTGFTPGFDYSGFESSAPALPKPGANLDIDFAAVKASIDTLVAAVKDVRRSDGALANGVVTADSLSDSLNLALGAGGYLATVGAIAADVTAVANIAADVTTNASNITAIQNAATNAATATTKAAEAAASALLVENAKLIWQSAWATTTAYEVNDAVAQDGASYICVEAHTSGTFSTDLAAGKWDVLAAKGTPGAGTGDMLGANNLSDVADAGVARSNLGLIIGTNVQAYSAVLTATEVAYTTALNTKLAGIETGATADQSASEILTALKTVDGSGSGLDADTLDGNEASAFWNMSGQTLQSFSRTGNTVYQNSTGKPIAVYWSTTATGVYLGATSGPSLVSGGAPGVLIVPAGWYFKFTLSSGDMNTKEVR